MLKRFDPNEMDLTRYLFFTGKGGVGKTSTACALAVSLADGGKQVMLVSTDPASNLQDVFQTDLDNKGVVLSEVPGLTVANFDPETAAAEYRESVVGPYRGILPDAVVANMEEQLSGSCTVEIAAFNEFSGFITDPGVAGRYDHIIFDTAPTGHTLRMLQLPSAWTGFINESTHGASCLGQLAGLEAKKDMYARAVTTLADGERTTLVLVSRPEDTSLAEAARASGELAGIGVDNQLLLINGLLQQADDPLSESIRQKQQAALAGMPEELAGLDKAALFLKPYNVTGLTNLRAFLGDEEGSPETTVVPAFNGQSLSAVVDDLADRNLKVIFTMGKGGVGKTTIAATVALGLARRGKNVHLTTTDPAAHLSYVLQQADGITISSIDEKAEVQRYRREVLEDAKETMSADDLAYLEEELSSPCTQEIAVFRAFADVVDRSEDEVVVIDTAPTGHTLLLLDATQSYHREIERSKGDIPPAVKRLLPRLRDPELTEVLIVTLPETTPYYEARRLEEDLARAGIHSRWWVVNSCLHGSGTTNRVLQAKSTSEIGWLNQIQDTSRGQMALVPWQTGKLSEENLLDLLQ